MKLFSSLSLALALLALGHLTAVGQAQESVAEAADIQAIIDEGRDNNQVQEHLDYLTNRIGPRLTSSMGLQAGCEWARDRFEEMGLQNSRLEQWGEFPVGFERGPSFGRMLEPKSMTLSFGTNSWTAGTQGKVVGQAILAPKTLEELEEKREQLKGAFVFVERAARGGFGRGRGRRGGGQQAEELTEEQRAERQQQLEEAQRAAEVQRRIREEITNCEPAALIQSTRNELILTSGNYRIDYNDLPTIPSVNLLKEQFDEITELLNSGEQVKLAFDIRNFFRKGPIPLYNVIADIPGTEFPNEYVVVGGHIDSWDGATGATDNAAGCATAMEAARILMAAGVKPRRTIRFMLWSGEEQGLLGSRAYVEAHKEEMPQYSACLVHDGGTNYVAGIGGTKSMLADFEEVFAPAQRLDPRTPFEIYEVESVQPRGGSDHVSFIRGGVPGFFWRQRGRATYTTTHHTQYDTYETIVPEYQRHSSIVIALGAYGIANLDELLSREGVVSSSPGR